jgi:Ca2+-dependent lipid-binding protein
MFGKNNSNSSNIKQKSTKNDNTKTQPNKSSINKPISKKELKNNQKYNKIILFSHPQMGLSILRGQKFIGIQEPIGKPIGLTDEILYPNEDHPMIEINSCLENFYKPPQEIENVAEALYTQNEEDKSLTYIKETQKENIETEDNNEINPNDEEENGEEEE